MSVHVLPRGYATLLVTGRVLEDLQAADVDFGAFDAVVAKDLYVIEDRLEQPKGGYRP